MLISWLLSTLESCCRPLLAHLLLRPGRHPIPSASTLQLWKVCFCSESAQRPRLLEDLMGTIAQKGTYHGIRHADLQSKGVRCWFASEDMKIGDRLRPRLDETIRLYDKLLLVLSKTSVAKSVGRAGGRNRPGTGTPTGHHRLVPGPNRRYGHDPGDGLASADSQYQEHWGLSALEDA